MSNLALVTTTGTRLAQLAEIIRTAQSEQRRNNITIGQALLEAESIFQNDRAGFDGWIFESFRIKPRMARYYKAVARQAEALPDVERQRVAAIPIRQITTAKPKPAVDPDDFRLERQAIEPPAPAAQHFKHAIVIAGLDKMAAEINSLTDDEVLAAEMAIRRLLSATNKAFDRMCKLEYQRVCGPADTVAAKRAADERKAERAAWRSVSKRAAAERKEAR